MTAASLASCALLAAWCCATGCSVYGPGLRDDAALTTGGASANAAGAGAAGVSLGGDAEADNAGASAEEAGSGGKGGSAGAPAHGGAGQSGGSAGGSTAGGVGTGGGTVLVDPNLIDDLEDDDKTIAIVNNPRRDGIWDVNNDGTAAGTQTPKPGMFQATALAAADRPYQDDLFAAYTKGSGFTNYGAYMNVSMRSWATYADTPVYDASGYTGITFLAKVGSGVTITKKMRVRFISGDTDPRKNKCKLPDAMPAPTHEQLCYNHYYIDVTLSAKWLQTSIKFKDFVQGTDGMLNSAIDLKEMYGLEFYFATGADFEVWVDDLSFTK